MKKIILFTIAMLFASYLFAQKETDKIQSNAERFSEKAGSLIQREFEPVGTVARCKIEVIHYKDLIDGYQLTALHFEYGLSSRSAILDADEVDGFIISLNTIKSSVLNTSPVNYTEINYRSRDGFSGGCYCDKGKWICFIKLVSYEIDSFVQLSAEDFSKLLSVLQAAKEKM